MNLNFAIAPQPSLRWLGLATTMVLVSGSACFDDAHVPGQNTGSEQTSSVDYPSSSDVTNSSDASSAQSTDASLPQDTGSSTSSTVSDSPEQTSSDSTSDTSDPSTGSGDDSSSTCVKICAAKSTQNRNVDCGFCGVAQEERACAADGCAWGPWQMLGECDGQGECAANSVETEVDQRPCGNCDGVQYASRTCSAQCQWQALDWDPTCHECQSPGLSHCNAAKGKCECSSNDDCASDQHCCVLEEGWAFANECFGNDLACPFYRCDEPSDCLPDYSCKADRCEGP